MEILHIKDLTQPDADKAHEILSYILKTPVLLSSSNVTEAGIELLTALPVMVRIIKIDKESPTEISISTNFEAYTVWGDKSFVYMDFIVYKDQSVSSVLNYFKKLKYFYSYVYLHEVLHILRYHNTEEVIDIFKRIANKIFPEILEDENRFNALVNIACDYAINIGLVEIAHRMRQKTKRGDPFVRICLYSHKYRNMSEFEIFQQLLSSIKKNPLQITITPLGTHTYQVKDELDTSIVSMPEQNKNPQEQKPVSSSSDEVKQLGDLLNVVIRKIKGDMHSVLEGMILKPTPVTFKWWEKLKKEFKLVVKYHTQNYKNNWKSLNNKLRRFANLPSHEYIDEKINMILTIDQSGSMTNEELGKLLYSIENIRNQINTLTIIIHDVTIQKIFTFKNSEISKQNIMETIGTRFAIGGTSHKEVLQYIDVDLKHEVSESILVIFSDMISDLEEVWSSFKSKYQLIQIYLITTDRELDILGTIQYKI